MFIAGALAGPTATGRIGPVLLLAGVLPLLVFAAALRERLGAEREGRAAWGAGLVLAGATLLYAVLWMATTLLESYGGDAQAAKAVLVIAWSSVWAVHPPAAVLVGATTFAAFRGALPGWTGWLGVPVLLALTTTFFGGLALAVWTVGVSIAMVSDRARVPVVR